jgi:hypothetical protein
MHHSNLAVTNVIRIESLGYKSIMPDKEQG